MYVRKLSPTNSIQFICFSFALVYNYEIKKLLIIVERGLERQKSEHRRVRTSKVFLRMIRTSKDQNVENLKRIRTSKVKLDFRRSDIFWRHRQYQNVESSLGNHLWHITYVYQGLWGVRLGSIRLGKVWLGWVRLGKVRLCSVRLD